MKLAQYMSEQALDDEAMAQRVRDQGVKCDRSMISRYRGLKRRPDWPIINCLAKATDNAVSADDWMKLESAE